MRDYRTYAIRLAVEGGGQVKAELVSVGQSGEQSLKRIESAGDRASGGLKGLGRQAELLRTGIRTLGGALIGVTTVGGLAALVDRSISAADAIGKTADKIGVGVEALQELRFAAKASGVEQQTLDMALQRFTRRAAEAAQGTGEAKDALAQMGIAHGDLDDATAIAKAIHSNAGTSCSLNQLAAYLKQSPSSSAFRLRVACARIFGLTELDGTSIRLTETGKRVVDPRTEDEAKAHAFLAVPLYEALHKEYDGYSLPPPAALERKMNELGVSSKQTGKARQAF